jgi:hypothetical protein
MSSSEVMSEVQKDLKGFSAGTGIFFIQYIRILSGI